MTVKLYVSLDSEGHQWAPDHAHETAAAQSIAQSLWRKFQHVDTSYVLLANLHNPYADLLLLTERGFGVLELKHVRGKISIGSDGIWYAANKEIKSGIHTNPHVQVQTYATTIRQQTLPSVLPKELRRDRARWDEFEFQTAVCFTNPEADVSEIKKQVSKGTGIRRQPWETDFSVLIPENVPDWVSALRFGVDLGRERRFEPYRLKPATLIHLATAVFKAVEWTELAELMPDGEPWGYLVIDEDDQVQRIGLVKDEIVIGRSPENEIVVPNKYDRVSRRHAKITRRLDSVIVEDLSSKNGSFVNSEIVVGKRTLLHDQEIILGNSQAGGNSYRLQFRLRSKEEVNISITKSQ